jgi:hypothetical protein
MLDEIMEFLLKLYSYWLLADVIVFAFSMLFNIASGLESALAEALTSFAFGLIPFPFSLLIGWAINPLAIIIQIMITIAILFYKER